MVELIIGISIYVALLTAFVMLGPSIMRLVNHILEDNDL